MKRHLAIATLLLCAAVVVATLVALLKLRFDAGDVYPPYSTLRADPLGAMALYESLQRLPGISVRRDFQAANRLPGGWDTTYLQLAGEISLWRKLPEDVVRTIERFMIEGGRLVIILSPQTTEDFNERKETRDSEEKSDKQKSDKEEKRSHSEYENDWVSLSKRWDLEFGFEALKSDEEGSVEAAVVKNVSGLALPSELKWHSGAVLKNLGPSWRAIYSRDARPVVVERKFGQGGMVFATDSYFTSNEAMLDDRHAELLAWLVGPNRHVVFDEAHFGIVDAPGIAALARKYRLHGVIAALLILAGLFIWKNAVSLAPSPEADSLQDDVVGRDSAAGFVSLLRRNIKSDRLLDVCIAEWSKTFAQGEKSSSREKLDMEAIAREEQARPARERNPLETYRRICGALKSRKKPFSTV